MINGNDGGMGGYNCRCSFVEDKIPVNGYKELIEDSKLHYPGYNILVSINQYKKLLELILPIKTKRVEIIKVQRDLRILSELRDIFIIRRN